MLLAIFDEVTMPEAGIPSSFVICVAVAKPVWLAVASGIADVYSTFGLLRITAPPEVAFQSD